jgi:hypothetical protein
MSEASQAMHAEAQRQAETLQYHIDTMARSVVVQHTAVNNFRARHGWTDNDAWSGMHSIMAFHRQSEAIKGVAWMEPMGQVIPEPFIWIRNLEEMVKYTRARINDEHLWNDLEVYTLMDMTLKKQSNLVVRGRVEIERLPAGVLPDDMRIAFLLDMTSELDRISLLNKEMVHCTTRLVPSPTQADVEAAAVAATAAGAVNATDNTAAATTVP